MEHLRTAIEAVVCVAIIVGFIFENWFIRLEENFSRKREERKGNCDGYNHFGGEKGV